MRTKVPRIIPKAVSLQTVVWTLNTENKHFITKLALASMQNRESARLIRWENFVNVGLTEIQVTRLYHFSVWYRNTIRECS